MNRFARIMALESAVFERFINSLYSCSGCWGDDDFLGNGFWRLALSLQEREEGLELGGGDGERRLQPVDLPA